MDPILPKEAHLALRNLDKDVKVTREKDRQMLAMFQPTQSEKEKQEPTAHTTNEFATENKPKVSLSLGGIESEHCVDPKRPAKRDDKKAVSENVNEDRVGQKNLSEEVEEEEKQEPTVHTSNEIATENKPKVGLSLGGIESEHCVDPKRPAKGDDKKAVSENVNEDRVGQKNLSEEVEIRFYPDALKNFTFIDDYVFRKGKEYNDENVNEDRVGQKNLSEEVEINGDPDASKTLIDDDYMLMKGKEYNDESKGDLAGFMNSNNDCVGLNKEGYYDEFDRVAIEEEDYNDISAARPSSSKEEEKQEPTVHTSNEIATENKPKVSLSLGGIESEHCVDPKRPAKGDDKKAVSENVNEDRVGQKNLSEEVEIKFYPDALKNFTFIDDYVFRKGKEYNDENVNEDRVGQKNLSEEVESKGDLAGFMNSNNDCVGLNEEGYYDEFDRVAIEEEDYNDISAARPSSSKAKKLKNKLKKGLKEVKRMVRK